MLNTFVLAGSGSIDPDELRTVLKSCLRESAISLPEEKLDDLTLALFESADKDNSGSITFEELKAELETFPEVMENLTIRSTGPNQNTILQLLVCSGSGLSQFKADDCVQLYETISHSFPAQCCQLAEAS